MSEAIETALKEDSEILIEENLLGSEVSVGVYSKKGKLIVLPPTEIISKNDFFDYQAKYEGKCDEITPANLDSIEIEKLTEASVKLYTNLKIKGICRIDFIIVSGIPHLLEINSVPGLTPLSIIPQQLEAAGIKLSDFYNELIEEALKK